MHLPKSIGALALSVAISAVAIGSFAANVPSYAQSNRFIGGRVRFTNTGNPARQATIELRRRGHSKPIKITETDSTGAYHFNNLPPGLYHLKLRYKPGVCAETLDVDIRRDSEPEANILTEGC